ncbi:MAG TPA: 6-phosphogluconolactonase [Jatrophihabitantaceae bacterium]|nr:6-phosphogluconolactonase [Jatrophihabitantaceae bacterium]
MSGAPPEIVVEASADELAATAAGRLAATLTAALAASPVAHLGVTGGGILEQTMRAVRDLPARDEVAWHRVHVWWGDERFVPADSDDRNDTAAFAALFDHLPVDPAFVHRMPSTDSGYGDDAEAAAAAYAQWLAELAEPGEAVPRFDAMLLGIGPDGHCASLFPNHPGTHETDAAVIGVHNSPKPPPTRLSLTFPSLDAAREVWFLASGSGKADAVARAVHGTDRVAVPSSGPKGRERTLWLLDQDAAAQLSE